MVTAENFTYSNDVALAGRAIPATIRPVGSALGSCGAGTGAGGGWDFLFVGWAAVMVCFGGVVVVAVVGMVREWISRG